MANQRKKTQSSSQRLLHQKVKTARGRKSSSTRWLQRQLNDPYVLKAREEGYRSRAAYKLIEMDEKLHFLKKGHYVVDLGAAPGGWTQVAVDRVGAAEGKGKVLGIDLLPMDPINGAELLEGDFLDDQTPELLMQHLGRKADIVLSDMAASACGHAATDHIRIMHLCELAFEFAKENLAQDGTFIAKVLQGGTEHTLLKELKQAFKTVKHIKPPASRSDSAEMYVVALGFDPKQ